MTNKISIKSKQIMEDDLPENLYYQGGMRS